LALLPFSPESKLPLVRANLGSYTYPSASSPILRDVNLSILGGSLTLVTGPSGAGKSTLLRCINGLVPHFSGGLIQGKIEVAGLDPVQASPQQISNVSVLFSRIRNLNLCSPV